jgi:hypothetical protein
MAAVDEKEILIHHPGLGGEGVLKIMAASARHQAPIVTPPDVEQPSWWRELLFRRGIDPDRPYCAMQDCRQYCVWLLWNEAA